MTAAAIAPRFDWTREEIAALFDLPLPDLLLKALEVRHANWPDGRIQKSQLLSIKTGGCPEDCGYCSQSAHFKTGLTASKLMDVDAVLAEARQAKANGADRFCMGAAWRSLKDRDLPKVCEMISAVKAEGLETCVTLGMLEEGQAEKLKAAGLDYYNHNLDTSREYYGNGDDDPHLRGPARDAGPLPQGGRLAVLRRHPRHGREPGGPRRPDPRAVEDWRRIRKACRSMR